MTRGILIRLLLGAALLGDASSAFAARCLAGHADFNAGAYPEAIAQYQKARLEPQCHDYVETIDLHLAVSHYRLGTSLIATNHLCRAAELLAGLDRAGPSRARQRVAALTRVAPAVCAAARRLAEGEPAAAIDALQAIVDRQPESDSEETQREISDVRGIIARIRKSHFGGLRITCPRPATLALAGSAEPRPCPGEGKGVEWAALAAGSHTVTWTLDDSTTGSVTLTLEGGQTTAHHLALPAPPPPSSSPPQSPRSPTAAPPNHAAIGATVSAAALAIGGGVLLYLASTADEGRRAAESDYLDGDEASRAEAARRFDRDADRANLYGVGGWSALGLGAALGAVATWLWLDSHAVDRRGRASPGDAGEAGGGDAMGWLLTGGSAAFAIGGGALLYLAHVEDGRRADAGRAYAASSDAGEQQEIQRRFERAADRADVYGITGWSALGLGAALGAGAAWWWWGPVDAEVRVGPSSIGVQVRF